MSTSPLETALRETIEDLKILNNTLSERREVLSRVVSANAAANATARKGLDEKGKAVREP